ncbi:hypothetical protein GCM10027271_20090 [Saccharopolyspora gloriosae]|uniref:Acyl-CoA thioester hydrolase n=1 Tax=Saccharopolyspora gloriosae TaxID=455344 RepID=A0A840NH10_9PSEU|nr:hotdog domain-containing protein [Saccharopolyspora gloriosae]MBB5067557.1 acyl-CoA thioester hydrolase [Saccharopolyspora gloriosae]
MTVSEQPMPARTMVAVRQADLGRDGRISTLGVARWLEDARLRVPMPRFERLVSSGEMEPFRILLVGQRVERSDPRGRPGDEVEVTTGIRRVGRSSFTYRHTVFKDDAVVGTGEATVVLGGATGPLQLPDELISDLRGLRVAGAEDGTDRASAEQRTRDHYRHWTPLRTRVTDLDSNHHVNFQVLLTWYEEAIAEVVLSASAAGRATPSPKLASSDLRIEYTGEVTYPGDYEIGVTVTAVNDDTVHYDLAVFQAQQCLGTAQARGSRGELTTEALLNLTA